MKYIKYQMVILLTIFSFFYTDKVINFINNKDPLMDKIKESKSIYDVELVNAKIESDTIIPGKMGYQIDAKKSYDNMKIGRVFRSDALIYNYVMPSILLKNNMDKYIISGNKKEKKVSVIALYSDRYKSNNKNITIFANHKDIEKVIKLNNKNVYSYGNNGFYTRKNIINDNYLLDRKNERKYCLTLSKNKELLDICKENNMPTIIPSIIGGFYEVKNSLSNGSIILVKDSSNINLICNYIISKGYEIVGIDTLLKE